LEYTLRTLKSSDIFPCAKILNKIGIGQLKSVIEGDTVKALVNKGSKDIEAIGAAVMVDLAGLVLGNLPACETEIYTFLASVTGLKVAELRDCSMAEFAELVIALVKKDEFKDFIGVVSRLLK